MKKLIIIIAILIPSLSIGQIWTQLSTAPYNGGKQDDIYFINPDTGWAVNGSGNIFRTNDGGLTWTNQLTLAGTYFRCIQMIDEFHGFAGNIGTNYFPGVTDNTPLYETNDGGISWNAVTNINGPVVKGLCAFDIVKTPFINAGILDTNITLYGGGRVGGPTFIIKSIDAGQTWNSINMSSNISMLTDIKFTSQDTGFIFGGTNANISFSSAKILKTVDGGLTFTPVYTSTRANELIWKASFPSKNIGYATILSYDAVNSQRYIVKTIDGGLTWNELPLTLNGVEEFGIGFVNDTLGWVGTSSIGYQTINGGLSWSTKNIGSYVNKIRIIQQGNNYTAYAIGLRVFKTTSTLTTSLISNDENKSAYTVYPNPSNDGEFYIQSDDLELVLSSIKLFNSNGQEIPIELILENDKIKLRTKGNYTGEHFIKISKNKSSETLKVILGKVKP